MKKGFFKKNKIFGINLLYVISLLPIIIFSYYKNGYLVYDSGNMNLFLSLQYLIIPIIIIILSYVFENYYYLCIKKEKNSNSVVNSIVPYINALCYLVCGPNDKLWLTIPLIIVLDVLMKFLDSKVNFNRVALFKCLLFGILTLMGIYNNSNLYELTLNSELNDLADLFIGKGIGEIGTTSTLCALIGFIILLFNSYYKKDVPIMCVIGYVLVSAIIYFVGGIKFNELLINTLTSGFMFAAVFVASLSTATPVVRSGRIIYGLLIGVLSAITVNILNFNVGIYVVILIISLLVPLFNRFKLSAL